jgi:hypothetical protein
MTIDFFKRKFLFRCDECEMIISIEFDDDEDIKDAENGDFKLECVCGGHSSLLRN